MNSGIQDAWNLGWKLAQAERGRSTDLLLESYDAERRDASLRITRDREQIERLFTPATPFSGSNRHLLDAFVASLPGYERTWPGAPSSPPSATA